MLLFSPKVSFILTFLVSNNFLFSSMSVKLPSNRSLNHTLIKYKNCNVVPAEINQRLHFRG